VPSHESSRGKLLQCHMAVLRSLRQQISLTTSHQLESIIDSWKTATAYASSRYRCLKARHHELLKLSSLCAVQPAYCTARQRTPTGCGQPSAVDLPAAAISGAAHLSSVPESAIRMRSNTVLVAVALLAVIGESWCCGVPALRPAFGNQPVCCFL